MCSLFIYSDAARNSLCRSSVVVYITQYPQSFSRIEWHKHSKPWQPTHTHTHKIPTKLERTHILPMPLWLRFAFAPLLTCTSTNLSTHFPKLMKRPLFKVTRSLQNRPDFSDYFVSFVRCRIFLLWLPFFPGSFLLCAMLYIVCACVRDCAYLYL